MKIFELGKSRLFSLVNTFFNTFFEETTTCEMSFKQNLLNSKFAKFSYKSFEQFSHRHLDYHLSIQRKLA